jgi:hypothetical protein
VLHREIIAVCYEILTKHINTMSGQNVEFVDVKLGGTYGNHWALRVNLEGDMQGRKCCLLDNFKGK